MKSIIAALILVCAASVASSADGPALTRFTEINDLLRAGDEVRLRAYVEASFTDSMRRPGPGDPGILPFLLQLSRRHRGFTVVKEAGAAAESVTLVVQSVAEPSRLFRFNLSVEPEGTHRISGLFLLAATPEDRPKDVRDLSPDAAVALYAKEVDRLISEGFSGVVLLARRGEVVCERAAGESDRGLHVKNTPETVFGLASMNKMFTAVAIGMLVERGKLAYSDPVGRHLKGWLPDDLAASVTVEQLLTHTSGLGDYLAQIDSDKTLREARTLSPYREFVRRSKIAGRPEDGLRYSNTGYVVLGALIEAVSGSDYFDFVRSNIFVPAGMTRTDSWCRDEIVEGRAVGYIPPEEAEAMGLGRGWRSARGLEGTRGTSAGGGMSTAGDLFRFAQALVGQKLVKRETLETLLMPRVAFLPGSHYAYGFVVSDNPPQSFGHSGGFSGAAGDLRVYGDGEWTLVVLSNVSQGAGDAVGAWQDLARRLSP
jgi:D-alanyl-D-alanine carboxypeptidase